MTSPSADKANPLEIFFAATAVCLALILALLDIHIFHLGVAWPDEWTNPQLLQLWREGAALPFSFAEGCLQRDCLAAGSALFGPSTGALHAPMLLAFVAENLLLFAVGKRWMGTRAASWAVSANAISSFSLLRLRSLLAYSFLPLELLFLLFLIPHGRKPWAALLIGFLAAFFLVDYDAWLVCLPILGLAWLAAEPEARPQLWLLLLGFACGLGLLAGLSWQGMLSHLAKRGGQNVPHSTLSLLVSLGQGLRGYWLGAASLPYTGILDTPAFPAWAWIPLLAGLACLGRKRAWLLLWLALGFAPLLSLNSQGEPQRAIAAWPALCLLAGLGASVLARHKLGLPMLLLLGLGGMAFEARAFNFSQDHADAGTYLSSRRLLQAAQDMRVQAPGQKLELLTDLDNESGAAQRFFFATAGIHSQAGATRCLAVLPWEYAVDTSPSLGIWHVETQGGLPPTYLLEPSPTERKRLEAVDSALHALWASLPSHDHRLRRKLLLDYVFLQRPKDPWVRSACLEEIFGQSFLMGEFPLDLLKHEESEKLASASLWVWCANKLQAADPAWAQRLAERAHSMDPRRRAAWSLDYQLLLALGKPEKAKQLNLKFQRAQKTLTYGCW